MVSKIKSKRYTHNKIQRMMIHILCGFTKEMATSMKNITYIRLLGFNKRGKKYLNSIKKELEVPIISKITREKDSMLEYEIETTKIYDIPSREKCIYKEFEKIITIGENYD